MTYKPLSKHEEEDEQGEHAGLEGVTDHLVRHEGYDAPHGRLPVQTAPLKSKQK